MTNTETIDALHIMVGIAIEGISEMVDPVAFGNSTPADSSSILLEACLSQIDNITMASEAAGCGGLKQLCDAIAGQLNCPSEISCFDQARVQNILDWLKDLQVYIDQTGEPSLAEKLVATLPRGIQSDLLDALAGDRQDGKDPDPDNQVSIADPAVFAEDDELADDSHHVNQTLHSGNEILDAVALEIADTKAQLIGFLKVIFSPSTDREIVASTIQKYLQVVALVHRVSGDLGLVGLRGICDFITDNIQAEPNLGDLKKNHLNTMLENWPEFVLNYLRLPLDDQICLELVNHLQNEKWPRPLSDSAARELLEDLTILPENPDSEDGVQRQTIADPEDVNLSVSEDVSDELIAAFFQESPSHAANLSANMGQISSTEDFLANVESSLRLTHTIKGSASLIGVSGIANLTHHMEDILEYLAKKQVSPSPRLIATLQESSDCLEAMIDTLRGQDSPPQEAQRILQDVLDWANRIDRGDLDESYLPLPGQKNGEDIAAAESVSRPHETEKPNVDNKTFPPLAGEEFLQVPISAVDKLFRFGGETSIAFGKIQEHLKRLVRQGQNLREQDSTVLQRRFELENQVAIRNIGGIQHPMLRVSGEQDSFDSLELDRYDELYGTTHRFIESVADSRELALRLQAEIATLESLFAEQQVLNRELLQLITSVRMVSVGKITSRLQRTVRLACRATDKNARLEIKGSDLLLDSEVLDRLVDPLMHLLRNAVDHGIEDSIERVQSGKPADGNLILDFSREGNQVLIVCSDDGRGLDFDKIRQRAESTGILGPEGSTVDDDLARLILIPGFTTRESATKISGRGVGMDVVNKAVTDLKGSIDVSVSEDGGCRFTLRMPITLITSHSLIVTASRGLFAIPTNSIEQILLPQSGSFSESGDVTTFLLNNNEYPVKSLAELLNLGVSTGGTAADRRSNIRKNREHHASAILLIKSDTGLVAVRVDQVVNSVDLVVKSLGRFVKQTIGISGVATLGDGRVLPVLDIPQALRVHHESQATDTPSYPALTQSYELPDKPAVLIVDDSLSVRVSLSELATDAGYQAILARDGFDAIELLKHNDPIIMLVDLEMPNMNGLELTSYIRANETFGEIPIVMITSRTQEKHRRQAEELGVNAFFNKPYSADDLLATMGNLI